jgi:Transposase DDE domain
VGAKEQINLTDEDSRIMPVPGGGFDQSYNAQALVAAESLLVVASAVTQATNDKEQLAPMLEKLQELPEELGRAEQLLADSGYLSEKNVESCAAAGVEPLIAFKRERHHRSWRQRFAAAPKPPPASATSMQKMIHRLKTPAGRELYALRKQGARKKRDPGSHRARGVTGPTASLGRAQAAAGGSASCARALRSA